MFKFINHHYVTQNNLILPRWWEQPQTWVASTRGKWGPSGGLQHQSSQVLSLSSWGLNKEKLIVRKIILVVILLPLVGTQTHTLF